MGIQIFRTENWGRWENGPYHRMDFRLDKEKDYWLLQYLLSHCSRTQREREMIRLGLEEIPAPPVNIDDPGDSRYAPYILIREQVMREDDDQVLKTAALEAPNLMMRRFAFCRLTGFQWPPDKCDAYSYLTFDCGLKPGIFREDIVNLCRELVLDNGFFAREAAGWIRKLSAFTDDELADWASV